MKGSEAIQKIRTLFRCVKRVIKLSSKGNPKLTNGSSHETLKQVFEQPHLIAYQLIGNRIDRLLIVFKDLDTNLQRSELKINFKVYVSLTVFFAFLSSSIAIVVIPLLSFFIFSVPLLAALLFGVGGGMFVGAFSTIGLYAYPIYRADKLKRELEDELPFTTGYMAILSSAGVTPEKIFQSLSLLTAPLAASSEAKDIVRDINLFGSDIISALIKSSSRSPSGRFREMLEGVISTIHSGGNLAAYLRGKTKDYMKLKRIGLKKYSDTLSILSEIYVTLLLTGPLLLVIMLSVMAMLGGGNLGMLNPDLLLNLLTYIGIPLGAIMFLIILDGTSPKW